MKLVKINNFLLKQVSKGNFVRFRFPVITLEIIQDYKVRKKLLKFEENN